MAHALEPLRFPNGEPVWTSVARELASRTGLSIDVDDDGAWIAFSAEGLSPPVTVYAYDGQVAIDLTNGHPYLANALLAVLVDRGARCRVEPAGWARARWADGAKLSSTARRVGEVVLTAVVLPVQLVAGFFVALGATLWRATRRPDARRAAKRDEDRRARG